MTQLHRLVPMLGLMVIGGTAYAQPGESSAPTVAANPPPARWLSVGALSEMRQYDATRGLWAEMDLVSVNGWTLSGSAVVDEGSVGIYDQSRTAFLDRRDQQAVLSVGRTALLHGFELRGALGAGVVHTSASGDMMDLGTTTPVYDEKWTPIAVASARLTIPISPRVALTAGPTATYYDQYFKFVGGTADGATHRLAELVFVGGVSLRL